MAEKKKAKKATKKAAKKKAPEAVSDFAVSVEGASTVHFDNVDDTTAAVSEAVSAGNTVRVRSVHTPA